MSIQLKGNDDSVFSNDIIAPNIPTQGQIVGYQQGAWTPYAAAPDRLLSGVSSYNIQLGNFARVGNHVTLNWWMQANQTAWGYDNGVVAGTPFYIAGLPYNVSPVSPNGTGAGAISYIQGLSSETQFRCYPQTGSGVPVITFVSMVLNSNLYKDTQANYSTIFGALGSGIQGSVQYITDDTTFVPQNGATVS